MSLKSCLFSINQLLDFTFQHGRETACLLSRTYGYIVKPCKFDILFLKRNFCRDDIVGINDGIIPRLY